jgi:hypothetical protein
MSSRQTPEQAGASPIDPLTDAIARRVVELLEPHLAELVPERPESPALLDRRALARALDCSVDTIDKLRREGMPEIRLLDTTRYELRAVLEWLKGRS